MVGNGAMLTCDQVCPDTQVSIQGHTFTISFHLLPISGVDAVLGIDWLKGLGPVTTDYAEFVMHFQHSGHDISLKADVGLGPEPTSANQLKRLLQTGSISEFYQLHVMDPAPLDPPFSPHPIQSVEHLLHRYDHLFHPPSRLPPPRQVVHRITLKPSTAPVSVRPYRYPHFQKNEIERQVSELLSVGLIRPSISPCSSPMLLVKKKDETWRLCIDYRALNAVTVRDRFPIPTIDELLDELGCTSWFSWLDLRQGFRQILMEENNIEKTAFRTHNGHFEYLVMPFGLSNAPSTFQSAMNTLLQPFLRQFVTVFFDDILIYNNSLSSHLHHLEIILRTLTHAEFFLKRLKCLFAQESLEYLGHIVSGRGVTPEPSKIQAIIRWPTPKTTRELWAFLGLTGFYQKFVKGYASIAAPLTKLLCKDSFQWTQESQLAFDHLKTAMTTTPVLALPNFSEPFVLETDASSTAIGAVLM